jgi:uncharacterized protein YodC (DUF2158 family)
MSDSGFKVGDVVTLRSGGPKMTVHEVNPRGRPRIACVWFEAGYKRADEFPADTLMLTGEPRL